MDDVELVERCADGDNDAWRVFMERYERFLRFIVRKAAFSSTPDHELDDVHDEIVAWLFARDGRVLRTYRGESKLTSWLGVVVTRQVRRLLKKRAGQASETVSLDALSLDAGTDLSKDALRDGGGYRPEAIDALREALVKLSERDQTLLRGFFLQKKSYEELADEIGVKEASVGQLLFRAKQKLKKKLGGENFLEKLSGTILTLLSFLGSALS